jgi:hypothetical protein
VAPLKDKSSRSVGNTLIRILSTAVLPEILQSENGKEFLGYCIKMIKEEFHTIKVVKGRVYHPASQGSVERGNATFKEALDKWLEEEDNKEGGTKGKSWSEIGIYVINAKINNRLSRSKDKKSRSNRKITNDSPGRAGIRVGVKEAKINQANFVNDLRAQKASGMIKSPLELDDICTISIPKTIKSAVKNLPVMTTELVHKREGVCYKVCSKHGHITGTFSRFEVACRRNL